MKTTQQQTLEELFFSLCESCFWTASVFGTRKSALSICPLCLDRELAFIPLARDESYRYVVASGGLEIRFSNRSASRKSRTTHQR